MISDNPKFDVCSLSLDFPENSSALIKFDWYDTSFSITLFDGVNTWIGKMQSGTIETLSEQLGLSLQQYIRECQNAFSEEGREQGFIYLLKDDTFQWKKESSDMRILFGQIHIEKAPVIPTLHKIIDEMMNENLLLKNKLSRIEKEKMDLMSDNKHLIETLEENNKLASRMENDLYERFLKVLNTKKEKIRELKKLRSSSAKSHGGENDADISKYECETDVDSDSDEGGDGDNGSSASEKEERSRLSDKDSDSDEMSNKSLLPKRNRLITSKQSVPDELVKSQEESSLGSKKSVGLQKNKSESQRNEPTNLQPVPSTSSCFQKKVYRSVAFVDSNEELEENITIFPSDEKLIPDPKSGDNISSVMHSPKKHGRFRDQTVEDEHSVTNSESGPSAKIPKIGNKCVSDESDFSIKHSESNNLSKINQEPDVCERHRENPSDKQTKVSVKDLIDGLFS